MNPFFLPYVEAVTRGGLRQIPAELGELCRLEDPREEHCHVEPTPDPTQVIIYTAKYWRTEGLAVQRRREAIRKETEVVVITDGYRQAALKLLSNVSFFDFQLEFQNLTVFGHSKEFLEKYPQLLPLYEAYKSELRAKGFDIALDTGNDL